MLSATLKSAKRPRKKSAGPTKDPRDEAWACSSVAFALRRLVTQDLWATAFGVAPTSTPAASGWGAMLPLLAATLPLKGRDTQLAKTHGKFSVALTVRMHSVDHQTDTVDFSLSQTSLYQTS